MREVGAVWASPKLLSDPNARSTESVIPKNFFNIILPPFPLIIAGGLAIPLN
jgi:hypothetical protein